MSPANPSRTDDRMDWRGQLQPGENRGFTVSDCGGDVEESYADESVGVNTAVSECTPTVNVDVTVNAVLELSSS